MHRCVPIGDVSLKERLCQNGRPPRTPRQAVSQKSRMTVFHELGLGVNLNVVQQENRIVLGETAMNKLDPSGVHDIIRIKKRHHFGIQVRRRAVSILRGILPLLAGENLKWKPILVCDIGNIFGGRRGATYDDAVRQPTLCFNRIK